MQARTHFRGDIFGGITAAIVALPLALAFGVGSGAGALAGLYGAIMVGFFAALFGGTPTQISGPTGPMTVVMASVIAQYPSSPALVFTVVMLAGLLQVLFGLAGFGRFIKLVPHPVVSGFMTGIGLIVIILQFGPLLGYVSPEGSNLVKLAALPSMLAQPGVPALVLGLGSFAIVMLTPAAVSRWLPAPLLAIVAGTLGGLFLFPEASVIGAIPSGLPSLHLPSLGLQELPDVLRFALVLAFLGAVDSLLTSLVADSMTHTSHDSNRELVGQGIGNMVAGLFGGIAGAGATMRTLVNIRSGGRTRLSGAVHALVLLALVLAFSGAASRIPLAVLAGILLKVGIDIIDWRNLRRITRLPRTAVLIMLTTLAVTVFVDLMAAVAVGVVMASLIFVSRMAEAQMESVRFSFGSDPDLALDPEEAAILDEAGGRIVLFEVAGPLSFASIRDIARQMQASSAQDALVIDLSRVPFIDSSTALALEESAEVLRASGDSVLVAGACPRVSGKLARTDLPALLGEHLRIADRKTALLAARELLRAEGKADVARTGAG